MPVIIESVETVDVRFPTSRERIGSDSINKNPDYSAAYVILKTNKSGLEGHGLTFTEGRGNELCTAAIHAFAYLVKGKSMEEITSDMAAFWRTMIDETQLRWLGPRKGVIHMATGALINAIWDLYAKMEGKPLWKLLADMSPEELISCIDFKYLTDLITPEEAVKMLSALENSKRERIDYLLKNGYPAYTTSAGWLGYSDEKIRRLCKEAKAEGWTHMKMKVGADIREDVRRAQIIRDETGWEVKLMMDANQNWEVREAIENMKQLAKFNPWWIEEPTSPDDILGHLEIKEAVAPIKVATGENCQNNIMFKQFLKSGAIDICQIDSCRVGGVNEVLSIMLMAAKLNIPVCPHAGGVGLCEYVQHLSMIDFICISGTMENRITEYVDHLHEHFKTPVSIEHGCYMPPLAPGYSVEMKKESLTDFRFPDGETWQKENHG
jgi:L-fuconate dehydratase